MKGTALVFAIFILSFSACAQHTVQMKNLWAAPQVHVLFQGYKVSFTIKDIDRALELLAETGDTTYGTSSGLDTAKEYSIELYAGYRTQYHSKLQPLLQKGVGAFLLTKGHALIENGRHRKVKQITIDTQRMVEGESTTDIKFYDPYSDQLIFNGQMAGAIKNADLGIDY